MTTCGLGKVQEGLKMLLEGLTENTAWLVDEEMRYPDDIRFESIKYRMGKIREYEMDASGFAASVDFHGIISLRQRYETLEKIRKH